MQVNSFNNDVRLLEIVNKGKISPAKQDAPKGADPKQTFSVELNKASRGLSFSKHASQRLYSRGIEMSDERLQRLSDAVDKAADKGSKESLILDDSAAYVVSVPNRTVITAFDRTNLQEGVFTSIDSAIIL